MIDANFAKQIIADLDRIKETLQEIQGSGKKVEKKEERKLWEIMKLKHFFNDPQMLDKNIFYANVSCSAIDAVIECYEEWVNKVRTGTFTIYKPFPEYLREKML